MWEWYKEMGQRSIKELLALSNISCSCVGLVLYKYCACLSLNSSLDRYRCNSKCCGNGSWKKAISSGETSQVHGGLN